MRQAAPRRSIGLIAATLVLYLVLVQPNHPLAMTWGALLAFPLELPVVLFSLVVVRHERTGLLVRLVLTVVLTLIVALKTADFISFNALARGFNPVADLALVGSLARIITGTFGPLSTVAVVAASVAALAGVAGLIWWSAGVWSRVQLPRGWARFSAAAAVVFAVLMTTQIGQAMRWWTPPLDPPGSAFTARVGLERVQMVGATLSQLRAFNARAAEDPYADAQGLLGAIDRDVLIIYIESYGRTSHDTPLYADLHRRTLDRYETRLAELGLAMRSGYLAAPTRGGQSWLSHATLANGLWIDNQVRYRAALASGRQSLFHHAARNGFHTAAVMPQITLDWPESAVMGFETVLVFDDLGYAGPAFNWVNMPDQFTLAALDRLLRDDVRDRRLFAQVALASSHAPWVPVPEILAWNALGDGRVYRDIAASGDAPETVWRDRDRVRAQYRLAIDYALQSVFEYALLHASNPPLLIVVGDHQAAEFVAYEDRPDVPLHIIGPAHLVDRLAPLAPSAGLLPRGDTAVLPMDRVRDMLLGAFSTTVQAGLAE